MHIVLSKIKGIICQPKVIEETLSYVCNIYTEILLLLYLVTIELHAVRIFVFLIFLLGIRLGERPLKERGNCECTVSGR